MIEGAITPTVVRRCPAATAIMSASGPRRLPRLDRRGAIQQVELASTYRRSFAMPWERSVIQGFESGRIETSRGSIFAHRGGSGPAVLLLHGFPETSLMWREIAPLLAADFAVIVADLPGYGRSSCPQDSERHAAMSKREMAATLVEAMRTAGHDRFRLVGHDRGGRVAYRAALDHADNIARLAVLDVVPTFDVWDRADARLALAFWPFSLLAQPFPDAVLVGEPMTVLATASAVGAGSRSRRQLSEGFPLQESAD